MAVSELKKTSRCAGCQSTLVWRRTAARRWTMDNPDGTPHWATCQYADRFRRVRLRTGRELACFWCGVRVAVGIGVCPNCGHQPHEPKMFCACPGCRARR